MPHGRQQQLHDLVAKDMETAALKELLETWINGSLGLNHKCQWVEERVEEKLLPVGQRWRWNRKRVR